MGPGDFTWGLGPVAECRFQRFPSLGDDRSQWLSSFSNLPPRRGPALAFCIIITTFLLSTAPLHSRFSQTDLIDRHIPHLSNCKVLSPLHIPRKMAGPSTNTTQRLLRELKDYAKSPNEALLHLGPVDDEDLLRWEAVLKGVNGTPYEGTCLASATLCPPQPK